MQVKKYIILFCVQILRVVRTCQFEYNDMDITMNRNLYLKQEIWSSYTNTTFLYSKCTLIKSFLNPQFFSTFHFIDEISFP